MQTFYSTFPIIEYDPKKKKKSHFQSPQPPLVLAIVPYIQYMNPALLPARVSVHLLSAGG